ncbi:MAG: helix-turn-helix transcriptional regulator, partial [Sphingomonadales bacterium]|nr:helix-turn-helix transcriptional regulator [Sphingomonadales bacterium]
MGPQDSATSNALLDATESVLRNEGYGAATSRRIAAEAGVKQQLVYYYFRTMDELLLATFKRRTERALARLAEDVAADRPVQALWKNLSAMVDGKLVFEFVALANHHEGI